LDNKKTGEGLLLNRQCRRRPERKERKCKIEGAQLDPAEERERRKERKPTPNPLQAVASYELSVPDDYSH
jgi:hypothetical protein